MNDDQTVCERKEAEQPETVADYSPSSCSPFLDLRLGDCLELIKGIPDKSFDLAITSPPYNMNLRVNQRGDGYCSRQVVKELSTKYSSYSDNLPMEEYERFIGDILGELIRVSETVFFNIQMITGNKPALFRLIGRYAEQIKEVVIWDKGHGQPAIGEGVLNSRFEFLLILGGNPITRAFKDCKFQRGTLDNVWNIQKKPSAIKGHGASFPDSLVNEILQNFGESGCRVIDPFLGTGTTALACHKFGAFMTGFEIDEDYFKAVCERIENETRQMDLFEEKA
jgi:site-specific DNA-methyltransferase (adenine-specific)